MSLQDARYYIPPRRLQERQGAGQGHSHRGAARQGQPRRAVQRARRGGGGNSHQVDANFERLQLFTKTKMSISWYNLDKSVS